MTHNRKHMKPFILTAAMLCLLLCAAFPLAAFAEEDAAATADSLRASKGAAAGNDSIQAAEDELAQMEDLLVTYDNNGNEVAPESIDENSFDGYIYVLKDGTTATEMQALENRISEIGDEEIAGEAVDDQVYTACSLDVIAEVADPEMIDYIEPDYIIDLGEGETASEDMTMQPLNTAAASLSAEAASQDAAVASLGAQAASQETTASAALAPAGYSDTYYSRNAWAYSIMQVQDVWEKGVFGSGQYGSRTPTIVIMDSGLMGASKTARRHEDLDYSKIRKAFHSADFSNCEDYNGHGTFLAGEISAVMNNGKGVTGLMPDVKIVPYKIGGADGRSKMSETINALNKVRSKGIADVVNMSFGSRVYVRSFQAACKKIANNGVLLIAACGNDGTKTRYYPASYDKVISVGSISEGGRISDFSNYNNAIDAVAPGDKIGGIGIYGKTSYVSMSGTSMAAPMVSALAAMAKSMDRSINYKKFRTILKKTSTDVGPVGRDKHYGYGIVNFANVYNYIDAYKNPDPVVEPPVTPTDPDDTGTDLTLGRIHVIFKAFVYNGYKFRPPVDVYDADGNLLTRGTDYRLTFKNNKKAGRATVIATGKGSYTGKVKGHFRIRKAPNGLSVYSYNATIQGNGRERYSWTFRAIEAYNYQGRLSYRVAPVDAKSRAALSFSNGSVTLKKGAPKGTFRLKVKVTAKGNRNYKKRTITRTITVRVR